MNLSETISGKISATPTKTAFVDVNLITMRNDNVQAHQTVLVSNGMITSIGDTEQIIVPADAFVIDGKGKYLLPGLTDMHVHLGDNPDDLWLYLVNGVTTIRNMWGYENFRLRNWLFGTRVFHHLTLRNNIAEGRVIGPNIVTAGPLLEGEKPFFPKFMVKSIKTAPEADEIVRAQAKMGYDLIKFYSTISEEVFDALTKTARENNVATAGHVPDRVGLRKVIEAGVTSIEHLFGFFNPYNPELAVKAGEITELAQLSAANNVYHCPTLIASERICNITAMEQYQHEPEMQYLPKRVKNGMNFLLKTSSNLFQKQNLKPNHEYLPFLFEVIRELKKQGAGILAGTDKATPFVVAGFGLHRELNLLTQAGLSSFEALQAATLNAAKCLKKDKESGTVEVGKRADLLLTNQNPLENLETLQKHCGVMTKGRWLSRPMCDEILVELQRKNK